MTNPKGATRFKCKRCGNSAMFIYEAQARIDQLMIWMGREQGYLAHEGIPSKVNVVSKKPVPVTCWVCGGSDIVRASRIQEEQDELESLR